MAVAYLTGWVPPIHCILVEVAADLPIAATVYYDGVASLMLTLVSFVGWVICRYSIRYLDGEADQGRYFRWTAFTIGAVSLTVISGNLLMFVASWVMTSLGLHHLLLHYGHRPAAQRAAWTKFTISRFGDVSLIVAIAILYAEFKTLDFAELFTAARSVTERNGSDASGRLSVDCWCGNQVGSIPVPHLVAANDGDTDTGLRPDARGDRECRRVSDYPNQSAGMRWHPGR